MKKSIFKHKKLQFLRRKTNFDDLTMLLSQYLLNIVIDYCYVLLAEGMNSGGSEVGFSSTTTPTHYTKTYVFKRRKLSFRYHAAFQSQWRSHLRLDKVSCYHLSQVVAASAMMKGKRGAMMASQVGLTVGLALNVGL